MEKKNGDGKEESIWRMKIYFLSRKRKTKKEIFGQGKYIFLRRRRKRRKLFGEGTLMVKPTSKPTDRQGKYRAICLWKIWDSGSLLIKHLPLLINCSLQTKARFGWKSGNSQEGIERKSEILWVWFWKITIETVFNLCFTIYYNFGVRSQGISFRILKALMHNASQISIRGTVCNDWE